MGRDEMGNGMISHVENKALMNLNLFITNLPTYCYAKETY